ncbi:hypothetical protein ABMA28_016120 [Loxostege sticticalis]|uniref:RNA-directed DNA polymerase n=1 Tax=Loxostege sticticalis TaxID=481309 RepID=A0ABD0TAM5_LOXSC
MSQSESVSTSSTTRGSRYLNPEKISTDPSTPGAELQWSHWLHTFQNFISEEVANASPDLKLKLLINYLAPGVFAIIKGCASYDEAIELLKNSYEKPRNRILARHILSSRQQKPEESIRDYVRALKLLAQDCDFQAVSAQQNQNDFMCITFISGINSQKIRQRLLENLTLSFDDAQNQALTLETAEKSLQSFSISSNPTSLLNAIPGAEQEKEVDNNLAAVNFGQRKRQCFFCGGNVHQRIKCPAFHSQCQLCSKKGHFANVCRSRSETSPKVNAVTHDTPTETASVVAAAPGSLRKATIPITINDYVADALVDTGSSVSFIDKGLAETLKLKKKRCSQSITLASLSHTSIVEGSCTATLKIDKHTYSKRNLLIVNNLCADVIIGHDILRTHSALILDFGGEEEPLNICNVMEASVPPASIFSNLSPSIKPIAIKSRRHSEEDEAFIKEEVIKLLEDGVIKPSISPWRAQVLVAGGGNHRKRLVIDYSRTINNFTELDAYPLPKIESIISKVSKFNFFSQIDLKSAYHQVPILKKEQKFTAFEACGKLYEFTRIPFGVTNGVAAFQRTLEFIIEKENLVGTYAYLDDVTICGVTKDEHDKNLNTFLQAAEKYRLTLNKEKCTFCSESINLLGHTITNQTIKPDKSRIQPLLDLPVPKDSMSLRRVLGLFAHYSPWVRNFSHKIRPLVDSAEFPLSNQAISSFNNLKSELADASLHAIDLKATFTVETDASEYAIGAILSQDERPVAYFSRSLSPPERRHSSIEKEACAIVEALRKWRHLLLRRHFILITDQQSVAFMLQAHHSSKIKNEKVERWRLELSAYKYDVIYRPGKENLAADALSRVCAQIHTNSTSKLIELHSALGHPGITRMTHWIRTKNLPYSVTDIRAITSACRICAEVKPQFNKFQGTLIKATAVAENHSAINYNVELETSPFERLSLDFKGPIPSKSTNKYILTIIDEFSRFPFAYPCQDLSADTVIRCLKDIFFMFGTPLFIHSDRSTAFMSERVQQFLRSLNIASSRTTPYNPQGNGQIERLNGTMWRTVQLFLKSKGLDVTDWEQVLPESLHSIRSLLCTASNCTPHEIMFSHPRRTMNGQSMPTWLSSSGTALMKRNVRTSKYDPLVEEVELLQTNPSYSHIRLPDGRETTISNRHLSPLPDGEDVPCQEDTPSDLDGTVQEPESVEQPDPAPLLRISVDSS